jgi:hypothetical protein
MNFLSWWGAGLSTFLALIKIWEIWLNRFRIDVSHNFTSLPDVGNEIFIRNLTGYPVLLSHWELLWLSGKWWPRRVEAPLQSSEESGDTRIDPHSSITLHFVDQNHFDWGVEALSGRKIAIRLFFAGRRSILRRVYG